MLIDSVDKEYSGCGENAVSHRVRSMLYRTLSLVGDPGHASGEAGGDPLRTAYGRQCL